MRQRWCALLFAFATSGAAAQSPWGTPTFPQDAEKWWWDKAWWESGRVHAPVNHAVTEHKASYRSGDVDVPVTIFRPQPGGGASGSRAAVSRWRSFCTAAAASTSSRA